jgi:hypothetical protein
MLNSLMAQESPLLNFRLSLILMKEGGDCGLRDSVSILIVHCSIRMTHIVHTVVTV